MRHKRVILEGKATPYENTSEVYSIDTSLGSVWKYSPKFRYPIAETMVNLTGHRYKDYKIAENECGIKHISKVTVWHHVWEKDNSGKYTMQLVDFRIHQQHCPHAGGCKMWLLEHDGTYRKYNKAKIYLNDSLLNTKITIGHKLRTIRKVGLVKEEGQNNYSDIVIDGIFAEDECMDNKRYVIQKRPKMRNDRVRQNEIELFGCDPYGNLIYRNRTGNLFFYNHEDMSLSDMNMNVQELL